MQIIFQTDALGEPIKPDAPLSDLDNWPRLKNLAWVIVNDEGVLVRGFSFKIKHTSPIPGIPEDVAVDMEENGHDAKTILTKFLKDYEGADTLVAHNLNLHYSILAAEAIRYGVRANKVITNRFCTIKDADELYPDDGRSMSNLWRSLFDSDIDDNIDLITDLKILIDIISELNFRGMLRNK